MDMDLTKEEWGYIKGLFEKYWASRKKTQKAAGGDKKPAAALLEKPDDAQLALSVQEAAAVLPEQLPAVITSQMDKIRALEEKMLQVQDLAEDARISAVSAAAKSAGLFKKRAAIEALQGATYHVANAQEQIVEAMSVSFEYQQQLGQIVQYLFLLGVSNVAATRTVIRQLQLSLQNAPEGELSELARQEILTVIAQLQAQEDMANRQQKQSEAIGRHRKTLQAHEAALEDMAETDARQDTRLEEGDRLNREQEARLGELTTALEACREQLRKQEAAVAALEAKLEKWQKAILLPLVAAGIALVLAILGCLL